MRNPAPGTQQSIWVFPCLNSPHLRNKWAPEELPWLTVDLNLSFPSPIPTLKLLFGGGKGRAGEREGDLTHDWNVCYGQKINPWGRISSTTILCKECHQIRPKYWKYLIVSTEVQSFLEFTDYRASCWWNAWWMLHSSW